MTMPWLPPATDNGLTWVSEEARVAAEHAGLVAPVDGWGEFLADGRPFPALNPVAYNNLATFGQKLIIGDTTRSSDDLIAARIYSNFTGGGQTDRENSGSDQQRFWYSTLYTRAANQLSLNPLVTEFADPTGATGQIARPIGDIGGFFYVAWGTRIHRFDPQLKTFTATATATLPAAPVGKGVLYDGKLWVPCGAALVSFDGATVATAAGITAVAVHVPDTKLWALGTNGQLRSYFGGAWAAALPSARVYEGTPRNLLSYMTDDNPVLHVVTSRGVWAFDETNGSLYKTKVDIPPHPSGGRASCVWANTANLYATAGLGVYQYNGGSVSTVGLDRDYGLPARNRGFIVDLQPEINGLYALIQGQSVIDPTPEVLALGGPAFFDTDPLLPGITAVSSMMYWTSFGWHTLWESSGASGLPTWSMVCAPSEVYPDSYGLMWGYGDRLCYSQMSPDFFAPLEQVKVRTQRFQPTGTHEQGSFSFNMETWPKTASHAEMRLLHCDPGCTATMSIQVDAEASPTVIGVADAVGNFVFQLGPDIPEMPGIGQGVAFDGIRVFVTLTRPADQPTYNVIVDNFSIKLVKEPLEGRSWQVKVPLPPMGGEWKGRSAQEISEDMDYLTRPRKFFSFTHQGRTFRVRTAYVSGTNATGPEGTMARSWNLVEIRTGEEDFGIGEQDTA